MKRILITPVKNEAHFLERFIQWHTRFFDHIIIADQNSSDGSWEIANSFEKVTAIRNTSMKFNEWERRNQLLTQANKLAKGGFIIGLDADEFLITDTNRWDSICQDLIVNHADATIRFSWSALLPSGNEWIKYGTPAFCRAKCIGDLEKQFIHVPRVPYGSYDHVSEDAIILHLNLFLPKRQQMKSWWYMALEAINGHGNAIDTLRLYTQSATGVAQTRIEIPPNVYKTIVEITQGLKECDAWDTWHKDEILQFLRQDTSNILRKVNIWDYPWNIELLTQNQPPHTEPALFDELIFWWIKNTMSTRTSFPVRLLDKPLRKLTKFN